MPVALWRVRTGFVRFQRKVDERPFILCLVNKLSTFCPCPGTREAEFKGDVVTDLVEGIQRQHSIQTVAWMLLVGFSQVCHDNQEQKAGQKDVKNLQAEKCE